MLLVDGAPFLTPRAGGVARALAGLLVGFAALEDAPPVRVALPEHALVLAPFRTWPDAWRVAVPGTTARAVRRGLPRVAQATGATCVLAPWSAANYRAGPVVVWMHECPDVRHGAIEGRLRLVRQQRHRRRVAAHAAAVVVPSEQTASDVTSLFPRLAPRVHVIPNAFVARPWLAARGPAAEPPYIVALGTGAHAAGAMKKGMDLVPVLRRGLQGHAEVRVVGGGDDVVPERKLRALVAGAAALVHPARSEGFGYPVIEAAAAGVPVITTTQVPVATAMQATCVAPGDPQALIDATLAALRRGAGARGRVRAGSFEPFAPARVATQWLDVIRDVAVPS